MQQRGPVALVMPFKDEAERLPAVLASIAAQRYDGGRLRLIAVDNGSRDGGGEIVRWWLERTGMAGEVVDARRPSIPHALNCGLGRVAADEIVVRLDAHTVYGPEYVAAIEQALSSLPGEVWCVGGAPVPGEEPRFGEALHAALFTNPMGLGPAPFRSSADVREVEHVYLGGWRPGVLQRLGGWDERWRANEDCELSARLRAGGGRIVRIPLESRVLITRGPLGAVRQWARYGYWRARTIREHPEVMRGRHLIPPVALLGAAVAAATPLRVALLPAAGLYAAGVIAGRRREEAALVTLASPGFFAAVHVAYALGLLAGAAAMERGRTPTPAAALSAPPVR
jgi:succinoglycan biosynthesis protein ExoA